jgi:hypothetical protein
VLHMAASGTSDLSSTAIILPGLKKSSEIQEMFIENKPLISTDKQKNKYSKQAKPKNEFVEEGVFVQYAGIVLVHPFLSSLFNRLQLVAEGKFKSTRTQQKAIYLLHYIATNIVLTQEYELVIPKILCDWPLQMPVERDIEISEGELQETNSMLQAVIEGWTVLKNTSVAGLQEGLLQRKGKLYAKNDSIHLQVEATSIDVLLDQLPWNLSMIKLPWMKRLLRVEWR